MSAPVHELAWRTELARSAAASHRGDRGTALEHRREAKALRLAEQIERQVNDWPPLTAEQRERIAALLHGAPETRTSDDHEAA